MFSGTRDGTALVRNIKDFKVTHKIIGHIDQLVTMSLSEAPGKKGLLTGSWDNYINYYNLNNVL